MNGAFIVDKPKGWTSHDVVNRIRRLSGIRKVGHLGTLDPLATGVLPLLVGRATRLAQFFGKSDKRYEGTLRFGFATDTWDAEGTAISDPVAVHLDCGALQRLVAASHGRQMQTPPPVSAKKIGGVPAYKLARRNQPVELQPVEVEIQSIELLRCGGDRADVRVHCSSGTYMRAIAHDLGKALGCGAHLESLCRLSSGPFELGAAHSVDQLAGMAAEGNLPQALIPAAELLPEIPTEIVAPSAAASIRQGRTFRTSPFRDWGETRYVKAVTASGELIAIGEAKLPNVYQPVLVL